MPNIVVTSNSVSILVDFGDYAGTKTPNGKIPKSRVFDREDIIEIDEPYEGNFVSILMSTGDRYDVVHEATSGAFIVDSVDAAAPSSLTDLRDKIRALMV
jgi:hypothetical protein